MDKATYEVLVVRCKDKIIKSVWLERMSALERAKQCVDSQIRRTS